MSSDKRQVGVVVHFVDATGVPHNALVTAWWSETCCNVVIASGDITKQDVYGRQIERYTSVMHKLSAGATFGMYWKWPEEELTPKAAPISV